MVGKSSNAARAAGKTPRIEGRSATAVSTESRRASWPRWVGVGLGVVLVVVAVVIWRAGASSGGLVGGGIVDPPAPAANFTLTDQFGREVSLSSLRGKPVALTFIYTNCPDACPVIASNMHAAYLQMGGNASRIAMVAVTVDPEHDGVPQILKFSQDRGLENEWQFLTGSRAQLEQVWQSYGIAADTTNVQGTPTAPSAASPDLVEHSAPIFLIDKHGNVRELLPLDFKPSDLATDLNRLAAES